ncbi:hypothetical protein DLJ46_18180 [Micromonospora globispora]|uniref:Uncharacterized protein n=1 Tax=Micromonospora globispora TaxID=1450148 RepID=A0A317K254_9ACTN|nr:hypothetical protein [Micromonospora globispora]PWU46384.1 hypothetical protein DLJ46_18180 [Micromonospora globispora]RQW90400.1 hypothetical protein DKL51_22800 [Micromonospora globispora]
MNEFNVTAGDEELEYIRQIAREMTSAFGIDPDEAVGRIRRFWGGQEFASKYAAMALWHKTVYSWARHIYYGGQMWWLDGAAPEPDPYP